MQLVVGLGNPGSRYKTTRHNLGFMVVEHLAEKHGLKFKEESRFHAKVALWKREKESTLLILPQTYMNESGVAVREVVDYFQIKLSDILVAEDDVDINFGEVRFREKGSTGGHRGLESIETHLKSQSYARLRMGIGRGTKGTPIEAFVLEPFSEEENSSLKALIEAFSRLVEAWCEGGTLLFHRQLLMMKGENKKDEKGEKPAIRGDVHPEPDVERGCP